MSHASVIEPNELDKPILAKLTEIFEGEDCPVAFRFAIPNCVHVTQLLKDTSHRAPNTGRIRKMFRFKIGGQNGGNTSQLLFANPMIERIEIIVPALSPNLYFFPVSREISINNPNDPVDGLFTFNRELRTGQIHINGKQYTVKGGKTRRHKKNIRRKKRMTKKRKRKSQSRRK